jgi:hypothetical protein
MLKASALYLVIVIALVIAIICSSLIVTAYYYRLQYQKTFRYDQLQTNLGSAVNILLAGQDTSYSSPKTFSLFGMDEDTVSTQRIFWGAFDIGVARSMIQGDTLYKTFSIADAIDSTKWAALYLVDDSRPFSVSGKTTITGDAYIPPAGINQAYIDNQPYTGDKQLIIGKKHDSEKDLPILDSNRINQFKQLIKQDHGNKSKLPDTLKNSFLVATRVFNFGSEVQTIANTRLSGNIIIFSDTTLFIDSTAVLNNVMVYARSISVKGGFHGTCQLYATDTISIAPNCVFDYPSCLGVLRPDNNLMTNTSEKISFYGGNLFNGLIFTYEKKQNKIPPLVHISGTTKIKGMIYSQGYVEFQSFAEVDGSVFTNKFLYQNTFTRYENYINNTTINAKALSPYYLMSEMLPVATKKKKVLQWLETK